MTEDEMKTKIVRKSSRAVLGGFRPTDDPLASWFGRIQVALPSETWPISKGKPMIALAQFNLTELPYLPDHVSDLAMITVFLDQDRLPMYHDENGEGWLVRSYPTLVGLESVSTPPLPDRVKPFPVRWEVIEEDYPNWDELPFEYYSDELLETYYEMVEPQRGTKFGGWPSTIQGGAGWSPSKSADVLPEFAFQIDSEEDARWQWGDGGAGYFARGDGDEWMLTWQCY